MNCRPYRRAHAFDTFVLLFLISAGRTALGQANGCPGSIPDDVKRITVALDLCPQVSRVVGQEIGVRALDSSERLLTASDESLIQSRVTGELGEIRQLTLDALAMATRDHKVSIRQTESLQIAGAIIGMIGGGVGGGLHLVNNPQVGHAATVLGMTAGATGGGINLIALLTKSNPGTAALSASIRSFAGASANEVVKDPLSLVLMLTDMKIELAALENHLEVAKLRFELSQKR